jgi:glutathione peroxidase
MIMNNFHAIPWLFGALLSCTSGFAAAQTAVPAAPLAPATPATACAPLLQHSFLRLQDEKPQSLCQYSGKVLVIVNTASFCGFTSQYAGLEALYARYRDRGLVVLGFPSNDFSQETGSNKEIADFCENTFGVKFPMFAKSGSPGKRQIPCLRSWQKKPEAGRAGTFTNMWWRATGSASSASTPWSTPKALPSSGK